MAALFVDLASISNDWC